MAIDTVDRRLLRELQRDASLPDDVLADRLGLSPLAVRSRREALAAGGAIVRHVVVVDPALLDPGIRVLILVAFADESPALAQAFERRMAADPAVVQCHAITGEYEYALLVQADDAADFGRWGQQALLADGNILRYSSSVLTRQVKDEWPPLVPVSHS